MNLGSLIATLGIDNTGLLRAEREMRNYEKVANASMSSVNNRIKLQEGLIANVEKSIDALKQARKGAFSIEAIERYNKKIAEAEIHLKEYEQAGLPAEKQTNAIAGSLKKLGLQALTVAAAWKTFKSIMESTNTTSVYFHSSIESAKSGLDYFMKSITSADFSNFREGMWDSIQAGREFVEVMDHIANVSREYSLRELKLMKEIEQKRRIVYASDAKASLKMKIAEGNNMIALTEEICNMQIEVARESLAVAMDLAAKENKLKDEQLKYIIENYTKVEKLAKEYDELNKTVEEYLIPVDKMISQFDKAGNFIGFTTDELIKNKKALAALGPEAEEASILWEKYGLVTEDVRQGITDALLNMEEAEFRYLRNTSDIYARVENLVDRYHKEQEKLWKNHYSILYGFTDAFTKQMERTKLLFPIPTLGGTMPDYAKQMMMFQPSYLQRVSTELADIAARNAAFGNTMNTAAQQAQFLNDRLNILWGQRWEPDFDWATMDTMIAKYKELLELLAKPIPLTPLEQFQKMGSAAMDVMGSLSSYFSVQMSNQIKAVEEYAKRRHMSELWVAEETERIQKEMGKKMKAFAISQALINAALAITEIWKNYGTKLVTLPMAVALSALNAAKMGVEIATIQAQPMAEGGIVPSGYPRDTYPALLTSGEAVIPPGKMKQTISLKLANDLRFEIEGRNLVAIYNKEKSLEENY